MKTDTMMNKVQLLETLTPEEFANARKKFCMPLDGFDNLYALGNRINDFSWGVGTFKIGMEACMSFDKRDLIQMIHDADCGVFQDLKHKDIPATVKGVSRAATKLGVSMFNLHADGGIEMMQYAMDGVQEALDADESLTRPKVIGVTVLTSMDQHILNDEVGMSGKIYPNVVRLARCAQKAGLDGIVSSAQALDGRIINIFNNGTFVTPGVAFRDGPVGEDQKQVVTPYEAIMSGSRMIVMGRGITNFPTFEEQENALSEALFQIANANTELAKAKPMKLP